MSLHIYPTPKTKTAATLRNRSYSRLSYGMRGITNLLLFIIFKYYL